MAREYIVLDPAGYKRCDEPGFHWWTTGRELFKKYFNDPDNTSVPPFSFWNPRGTEWLLPQVRQFMPEHSTDPLGDLDKFVLPLSGFVSAPELTTPAEWVPTSKPGTAGAAANKWISTIAPKTGFTDMAFGVTNWTAFQAAAGVTLPSGFGCIGGWPETPAGASIGEAEYTPYLSWYSGTGDDDLLAFGWQDMAVLVYRGQAYVLQQVAGTFGGDWRLLAKGPAQTSDASISMGGMLNSISLTPRVCGALPTGLNSINLFFGDAGSNPLNAKVRDVKMDTPNGLVFGVGDGGCVTLYPPEETSVFWIAAAPGQVLHFQMQILGYEITGQPPAVYAGANHFDTGEGYKPTNNPKFGAQIVFRSTLGNLAAMTVDLDGQRNFALLADSQVASIQVRDETYAAWVSDGTHHAGYVDVIMSSGSPGGPGVNWYYLAPQFHVFELQFPVKLVDRECSPLTLDDTKFMGAECSTSLQEAGGKRGAVRLFGSGAAAFQTAGFNRRSEFPVHWMTDEDNDGTPDTIQAAMWVVNNRLTLKYLKVDGKQVGYYELETQGLLHPADIYPVRLPQLVNPDGGGFVEHTWAVEQVLLQSGIDTSDGSRLAVSIDPYAGTNVARLPGYWAQLSGTNAVKVDTPWAMDWRETFLEYADRISKTWSAWNLYEEMTQLIRYHPDLMTDLLGVYSGANYHPTCTIYATRAGAVAAGVPGQYYRSDSLPQIIDPEANCIRVTGTDSEGYLLPTLYEEDARSLNDPTYENHLGYRKTHPSETKMAVGTQAMKQICHIALMLKRQRYFVTTVDVPIAYSKFGAPGLDGLGHPAILPANVDSGYVVTLELLGDYRVLRMRDMGVTSRTAGGYHVTTLTLQKMPAGSLSSPNAGRWPGLGA